MSKKIKNNITVNISEANKLIIDILKSGLVAMLQGSPGIGKSDLIKSIAKHFDLKVIDLRLSQCDPTDLMGFPFINKETGKATYLPMDMFPTEFDEIPEGYKGWLLFMDEFNGAPPAVQKAAYKLILDKQVGMHNLHKKVLMIAAGNLDTDNAITEEMTTAVQSRLIHLELKVDHEQWIEWAVKNNIDHRITSFIRHMPQQLSDFKPDHSDKTFACPRTWEFLSRLLSKKSQLQPSDIPLIAGTISQGNGREFYAFTEIFNKLVTIREILRDPKSAPIPIEPSVLYALTGSISNSMNLNNIKDLFTYIKRLPPEFQVICLRESVQRNPDIKTSPIILKWVSESHGILF